MDNCVIYGIGERSRKMRKKIETVFQVTAFADNNEQMIGSDIDGIPVIPACDLKDAGQPVFVCDELHWREIAEQLVKLGVKHYCCNDCLCYEVKQGVLYPVSLSKPLTYQKENTTDFSVLFVQRKPCARIDKIAYSIKRCGVKTFAAYSYEESDRSQAYEKQYPFWSYQDLLEFVNESEFDIIHCANEPDDYVNILINSNKPVINDCHNIASAQGNHISSGKCTLEYIANTKADGYMYPTNIMRDIMMEKWGTDSSKCKVMEEVSIDESNSFAMEQWAEDVIKFYRGVKK